MSTDEPGKREQAKAERRSRIVHAARDLIRETGDTNLSMRMIAKRADVSLATPYNLFGSKHAVVLAVFEDERDFTERFSKIKAENAIERIFEAHALAIVRSGRCFWMLKASMIQGLPRRNAWNETARRGRL